MLWKASLSGAHTHWCHLRLCWSICCFHRPALWDTSCTGFPGVTSRHGLCVAPVASPRCCRVQQFSPAWPSSQMALSISPVCRGVAACFPSQSPVFLARPARGRKRCACVHVLCVPRRKAVGPPMTSEGRNAKHSPHTVWFLSLQKFHNVGTLIILTVQLRGERWISEKLSNCWDHVESVGKSHNSNPGQLGSEKPCYTAPR